MWSRERPEDVVRAEARDGRRPAATPTAVVALVLVGLTGLAGLAGSACTLLRAVTSPPAFQPVEHSHIHDVMHVMAAHVQALDASLRAVDLEPEERQRQVLAALDGIAAQARGLNPPGVEVSHAMLREKLPQFIRDVEGARAAASATPPHYFLAGSVSGACMSCHRPG